MSTTPMSEQPPVKSADTLQQTLDALKKLFASAGAAAPQGGQGPQTQPATVPQVPPMSQPQMPQGSMAAGLPAMNQGAQPVAPRSVMPGGQQTYNSGFNFPNKAARNAAVVTNTMQSLANFADSLKQQKFQKQVEEAKGVVATALQSGILTQSNSTDPQAKQLIADQASKMLGSKEAQKVLKDLTKPGSAAYYGAQQAYAEAQQKQMQQLQMQELQEKIYAEQARAQAEQSRAFAEQERARSESPEAKAALESLKSKDTLALQKLKGSQVQEAQKAVQSAMTERVRLQQRGAMDRVSAENVTRKQIADDRLAAVRDALSVKKDDQGKKALTALEKQWADLSKQYGELTKAIGIKQKSVDAHFWTPWTDQGKQDIKDIQFLQSQQKLLVKQQDLLMQKQAQMQQFGMIAISEQEPEAAHEPEPQAEPEPAAPASKDYDVDVPDVNQ